METKKYSAILGNLGNTRDRFCNSYKDNPKSIEMLKKAASIEGITGIELVGTWDIHVKNVKEMKKALGDLGFVCVSIIPDLFSSSVWRFGSLSCRDGAVRKKAKEHVGDMCRIAQEMNCSIINLWPGQDGYDYLFQSNYYDERKWLIENISELAAEFSTIKFALEYKVKEPRTHSYLARMADTLLVCLQTGKENVGVTIDTGHAFMGGENVSESIVMAKQTGNRLFHMHFNDNYKSWDDDMIAGSIHSLEYLEMLYWLDECGYDGWLSMDQYPYREDAAGAISESVNWLKFFNSLLEKNRGKIRDAVNTGNAVETSKMLRTVLMNEK